MGITIKDVAREAGFAISTVSRVLNNSGPVSDATRQRVESAAEALGYVPHSAARSLITNKTHNIGILLPDLHGDFYSEVIRGIDQTAQQHNYNILVSSSHNVQSEIEAALRVMRGRVDGLLVMSPDINAEALAKNLPADLPVILLNCSVEGTAYDAINIDNYQGAYMLTSHLIAQGHRRIAIIKGADGNADAEERLRGYRAALADHDCPSSPDLECTGDFREASGYAAAQDLLRHDVQPTAVFASNDAMAAGAMSAFREAGLRVPEDIAVGGFDGIPIGQYLNPPLTTIDIRISEVGRHAIERLLEAISNENQHQRRQEIMPTTLVVRESCGNPSAHSAEYPVARSNGTGSVSS